MKRLLLTSVAALFLATGTAHSASPWTEADGKNTIFIALKNVTCRDNAIYTVWIPYDTATQKQLNFLRITSNADAPVVGITLSGNDVLLNGVRCKDGRPEG
jgi:hypothetical protein